MVKEKEIAIQIATKAENNTKANTCYWEKQYQEEAKKAQKALQEKESLIDGLWTDNAALKAVVETHNVALATAKSENEALLGKNEDLETHLATQDGLVTNLATTFASTKDDDGFPFYPMGQEEMEALENNCKEDLTNLLVLHIVTLKAQLRKFWSDAYKSPFKPLPKILDGGDDNDNTLSGGDEQGRRTPKPSLHIPGSSRG